MSDPITPDALRAFAETLGIGHATVRRAADTIEALTAAAMRAESRERDAVLREAALTAERDEWRARFDSAWADMRAAVAAGPEAERDEAVALLREIVRVYRVLALEPESRVTEHLPLIKGEAFLARIEGND